eukprot:73348-Pelagomonas_calceolata.AAC.1
MKSLRRDALLGCAELKRCWKGLEASTRLVTTGTKEFDLQPGSLAAWPAQLFQLHAKKIHEFGDKVKSLISLLLQEMKNILRASLRIGYRLQEKKKASSQNG